MESVPQEKTGAIEEQQQPFSINQLRIAMGLNPIDNPIFNEMYLFKKSDLVGIMEWI